MKTSFAQRLKQEIDNKRNPSLLGLDPHMAQLPPSLIAKAAKQSDNQMEVVALAIAEFNRSLIEALSDIIPAVKFQSAYYEQLGEYGIRCLRQSIQYAKSYGLLTVLDAKRNDIGSTARAYANASLGKVALPNGEEVVFDADSVTVNAYLGIDGIEPFIKECAEAGKGCFILVRTSNPSAGDFQDLELADGRKIYEAMAELVSKWGDSCVDGEFSSVGAVVGATWPEQAKELRKIMPKQYFLIPGYGAQGGKADGAVAGFNENGEGGIVNASRSLMLAWQKSNLGEEKFAEASRQEAIRMREDLMEAIERAKN